MLSSTQVQCFQVRLVHFIYSTQKQTVLILGPWEVQLQSATCCQAAQGAKVSAATNAPGICILANIRQNIRQNDKQKQLLLTLGPWEVLLESPTCYQAA